MTILCNNCGKEMNELSDGTLLCNNPNCLKMIIKKEDVPRPLTPLNIERLKEKAKRNDRQPNGTLKNTIKRARNILKILEKYDFKCVKCGATTNLTIEHPEGRAFAKHNTYRKYLVEKCSVLCVDCHNKANLNLLGGNGRGGLIPPVKEINSVCDQTPTPIQQGEVE
jgi:hypothetical protein